MVVVQPVRVDQTGFFQSEIYPEEHEYGLCTFVKTRIRNLMVEMIEIGDLQTLIQSVSRVRKPDVTNQMGSYEIILEGF